MKYAINHEYVSINSQKAQHRIILVHGWGADADDLLPLAREIKEVSNIDFEIISLRAPAMHPNSIGRQWYGLYPHDWDEAEIEVRKLLLSLRKLDRCKIPLKKTILLGFSQGAAMSLDAGSKLDLGLIVSCSGYPHPNWQPGKNSPPIIISHGLLDEIVPIAASKIVYQKLKNISVNICKFYEFNGSHQIDINLINLINSTIKELF